MSPSRRTFTFALAGFGIARTPAAHAVLAAPSGPVLLTITGKVGSPNQGQEALFDMGMLAALRQVSHIAPTPWYAQPRKFTGPLLRDVLREAAAHGDTVRALALNDYRVDIPLDDAMRHDVILARLMDDRPMLVRDKGPLFVMYPFGSSPGLRSALYFGRCCWQLKALDIQ